ncbi:DUF3489 domain-containing protein [Reyranella sp.]|uniref:DUF3489 domain-containing protein n=1 Tax=Reyranella sp. TaxID=1929291 RepID=UPI00272F1403|nr:DUF3489 domain-containing protein [Reyranella sp.]MDP2377505.1 DUF3489 domain-containing protein [Reyranella sp.]
MIKAKTSSSKANARESKGTKSPKIGKPPAAKPSSTKLSQLEALLRRPEGATIKQLVSELDWLPHSVRGAISGSLKKKRSLKIVGKKAEGEERVYRIAE